MFEQLTGRLSDTLKRLRGLTKLSEDNIKDSLRNVRLALLEADVALPVVKDFIETIKQRAIGQEVNHSLSPGQTLIKVVHQELIHLMGDVCEDLNLNTQAPVVILVAGLQGSGKTTTVGKLARWLKERKKKNVAVVSADIYRPAAIAQLETLAKALGCHFYPSNVGQDPILIVRQAQEQARLEYRDVLIVDTAGRLHVDAEMMAEIKQIHSALNPVETLFVVDSMTGQDAANTAKAFNEVLPLTGVILTKVDGDARGGAALSVRHVTGKPIKFIGVGEKTEALEPFHPERMASRILGMGDILSLIEDVERHIDKEKAEKLAKKIKKGKGFDLDDFRDQLLQMNKLGGLAGFMDKLPGMGQLGSNVKDSMDDSIFKRLVAIINSMTLQERHFPDLIKGSRKRRIAAGSGVEIQDVNRLLKQFHQLQKMMKQMTKGGMQQMMKKMKGRMPPRTI